MSTDTATVEGQVVTSTDEPTTTAMLPFKDDLARYAQLLAFEAAYSDYVRAEKGRIFAAMRAKAAEDGNKSFNVIVDGEVVAGATITEPKDRFSVSDEDAFTEWVERTFPSEVETVTQVRDNFKKALLKRLEHEDEGPLDPATGELVPGVKFTPAGEPTTFSVNGWKPGKKEQVVESLFARAGSALGITTGGDQ